MSLWFPISEKELLVEMENTGALLVKNVLLYTGGGLERWDVLIEDGMYKSISKNLVWKGAREINGEKLLMSPGFTDLHVHLRQPGFEKKETVLSGTMAAAAGGFTTVCSMPNLSPVPDSCKNLKPQLEAIARDALVRVLPYGSISQGQSGESLSDISELKEYVCGFSDDGVGVQNEDLMYKAMKKVAAAGSFIAAHCELEEYLPSRRGWHTVQASCRFAKSNGYEGVGNESEWMEAARDIEIAEELKESGKSCRLHICHASTQKTFELVKRAKEKGLSVSCEVSPHNALLSCEDIDEDSGRYKMNPPLRYEADRKAAVAALLDGTADAIATDHAPHRPSEKSGGFRSSLNGVVGLETAFASIYSGLVLTGIMPLERLLQLLVEGPAKVLEEEANAVAEGKKADFTLIDLETEKTVNPQKFLSKGRSSPFEGKLFKGWPVFTYCNSKIVYDKL